MENDIKMVPMRTRMEKVMEHDIEVAKKACKMKTTSSDPRRAKIKELKSKIKEAGDELTEARKAFSATDLSKEEQEAKRKEIVDYVGVIRAMEDELKKTIMNRLSSTSFEFNPTPMNRRQKRAYLRRK